MGEEKGESFYNEMFRRYYPERAYDNMYLKALEWVRELGEGRILEIGMGTGRFAELATQNKEKYGVKTYKGFDFSQEAVESARRKGLGGLVWKGNAYDAGNYAKEQYNIVVCIEVLEHLDDLRVIGNIRKDSWVIASVPDFDWHSHVRVYPDSEHIAKRFEKHLRICKIVGFEEKVEKNQRRRYLFLAKKL